MIPKNKIKEYYCTAHGWLDKSEVDFDEDETFCYCCGRKVMYATECFEYRMEQSISSLERSLNHE